MTAVVERELDLAPEVLTEQERRARVLEAAALEIEVRGWTNQGVVCDDAGHVCAVGALKVSLGISPVAYITQIEADAITGGFGNEDWAELPQFNDWYADGAADVTFLFRWRAEEIRDGR
jgi:hypothetical protein